MSRMTANNIRLIALLAASFVLAPAYADDAVAEL